MMISKWYGLWLWLIAALVGWIACYFKLANTTEGGFLVAYIAEIVINTLLSVYIFTKLGDTKREKVHYPLIFIGISVLLIVATLVVAWILSLIITGLTFPMAYMLTCICPIFFFMKKIDIE